MKCMITGGAGFIGSHLADVLYAQGYQIIIVDNLSSGRRQNLKPAYKFYKVDAVSERIKEIFALEQPDLVFHLADNTLPLTPLSDPIQNYKANTAATLNILEGARIYNTRKIIFSSSYAVYGNSRDLPCTENSPQAPLSHYAVHKLSVEHLLQMYQLNYGLDFTVLRLPIVYGPRQNPDSRYGLVASILVQISGNQPVEINGLDTQIVDLTYIDDIALSFVQAIKLGGGQIINLGSKKPLSLKQLFSVIKAAAHYQAEAHYSPGKSGYIHKMGLNISKAETILNWSPQTDLIKGIKETINALSLSQIAPSPKP